ncbi:uncharacterized protein B0P05DRAFT_124855 [Gilbertella persicaria]|uniref:uncharacterized protein n=1 Tax=Gilbertella persicaria TaxID=101096 RepID=UPI002220A267|nr:uncharacterized protein B0P05DRAFT_124855 [Gilbertella persicaria]KAI8077258.1 hypothetical protein B0P05DRAFT_124855 [Gilbertella persicaria]
MLDLNNKVVLPNKKEIEFFKQNNLSNWNFKDFMQHCQLKNRMSLKIDKVISQYKLCLNNIKQCVQDDEVKRYVENLSEEVNDKPTEDQLKTTVNNFHNVNYGTATVMEAHGAVKVEQNNKKRKIAEDPQTSSTEAQSEVSPTTHSGLSLSPEHYSISLYDSWEETESEEEIVVEEDIEMNVWDIWKKILDTMQRDGDIDKYSLEHLNIVQLGNKLGSKITREYYPKNLIKKTGLTPEEIPCSFAEDNEFYNNIFDTIALSDEFSSNEVLVEAASLVFKSNNPFMKFFHTVLQSFVSGLFIDDSDVYNNEISYNYYILWPILNSLSKSIQKTKFSLGEKRLEAVSQELKLIHNDNWHFYNADGIISNIENKIEIAILETTGPYFNKMTQRKLKIISRLDTALLPCCMSSGESSTMVILKFSKKLALFYSGDTFQQRSGFGEHLCQQARFM